MDLRPQAHDIIRTWLFSTVLRSHLEENALPWKHAAISGWVLDPDRKKMSKSKGNVVTPMALLEEHGSDAVRYWAAKGGPGVDTAFDPGQMKVGRRLGDQDSERLEVRADEDRAARSRDRGARSGDVEPARRGSWTARREAFEGYDYAAALREVETFFWWFCDDYIELVKRRRAREDAGRGFGERGGRDGARRDAASVRAVPAVRHRRSVVLVARRVDCTTRRGRSCPSSSAPWPWPMRAVMARTPMPAAKSPRASGSSDREMKLGFAVPVRLTAAPEAWTWHLAADRA